MQIKIHSAAFVSVVEHLGSIPTCNKSSLSSCPSPPGRKLPVAKHSQPANLVRFLKNTHRFREGLAATNRTGGQTTAHKPQPCADVRFYVPGRTLIFAQLPAVYGAVVQWCKTKVGTILSPFVAHPGNSSVPFTSTHFSRRNWP